MCNGMSIHWTMNKWEHFGVKGKQCRFNQMQIQENST